MGDPYDYDYETPTTGGACKVDPKVPTKILWLTKNCG